MPVTVEIPVHARVDAPALTAGGEALAAAALRAAAGRALGAAAREVLPGSGELRRTLAEPVVRWSGEAVDAVDRPTRERLERALRAALAAAVVEAGLASEPDGGSRPGAEPAAEPADRERLLAFERRYVVPSYADTGTPVALPLDVPAPTTAAAAAPATTGGFAQPPAGWDEDDFIAALLRAHLRSGTQPQSGLIALMFAGAPAAGRTTYGLELFLVAPDWTLIDVVASTRGAWFEDWVVTDDGVGSRPVAVSAAERLRLRVHTGSPEAMRAIRAARLEEQVTRHFAGRDAQALPPEEREALRRRAIEDAVDRLETDPAERGLIEYLAGTASYLGPLTGDWRMAVPPGAGVPVIALLGSDLPAAPPSMGDAIDVVLRSGELVDPGSCEPFGHEPPVEQLGAGGALLRREIARLADLLGIVPCEYPGHFALAAAGVVASAAASDALIGDADFRRFEAALGSARGNLGTVSFEPARSHAVRTLRRLAATLPRIAALAEDVMRVHAAVELPGAAVWAYRFRRELAAARRSAAAAIFAGTCREVLLQILEGSRQAIGQRLEDVDGLAAVFELLLMGPLEEIGELEELSRSLQLEAWIHRTAAAAVKTPPAESPGGDPGAAWAASRDNLLAMVAALEGDAPRRPRERTPAQVEYAADGTPRIRDSRDRLWTMPELVEAIALRRAMLERLDPLVQQLTDLAGFLEGAAKRGVAKELHDRLSLMAEENERQRHRTRNEYPYGFRMGGLAHDLPAVTVGDVALRGVHLQAHLLIEDAFEGDRAYPAAVSAVFAGEWLRGVAIQAGTAIGFVAGSLLLAMVCPPAAGPIIGLMAAAGGLQIDLASVERKESLYQALIDPRLVLSAMTIEQERFNAWLAFGLGLVLERVPVPELDTLLGAAGRATGGRIGQELIEGLAPKVAANFLFGEAADEALELAARRVLDPFVAEVELRLALGAPVGSPEELERRLAELAGRVTP